MRVATVILFAVSCAIISAQQAQLFGPPKSGARFTSPTFAETFGTTVPEPKVTPQVTPTPKSCAVPLLQAAMKENANYAIQRVAPGPNPDRGMRIANGLPICSAPPDPPHAAAVKPPSGK